mgnify:CR=1 FL=1
MVIMFFFMHLMTVMIVTDRSQVVKTARAYVERQEEWSYLQEIAYICLMNFFAGTGYFVPLFIDHIHSILDLREALQVGSNVYGYMGYDEAHNLITMHPGFIALR